MSTMVVFQQMLVIFILIAVGYGLCKKRRLSEGVSKDLSGLVTNFCNPAIMLTGALDAGSTTREEVLITAAIAAVSYVALILIGFLIPKVIGVPGAEGRFYHMMLVYGNTGFIGIPVVSAVLGTEAVIYVTIFNLFYNILIYTHGITVLSSGSGEKGRKPSWKGIINVGTVCSALAVAIFWWRIPLPAVAEDSIRYMAQCVTFLSMVILGISLANMRLKEVFQEKRLYAVVMVRMLIVPILMILVMKQFVSNPMILGASALVTAMPAGNMPLMLAKQMDMECETLSKGIVLTTISAAITIPVVASFL